jgi:(p)ppGpp synthase/HD superfamily hydrolase
MLHDVIEDASKPYEDLEKAFGKNVADDVLALTKTQHDQVEARENG